MRLTVFDGTGGPNHCHMPVSASPNSRKRQHPEQPKQLDESLSVSKRQKVNHPSGSHPPAAFWNNLSTIWLTRRALQELNRRNTQAASNRRRSPQIRLRRPITRRAVAEWKRNPENWRPVRSAVRYLADCTKDRVEEIVSLSRHGGPDLSDLRGVSCTPAASSSVNEPLLVPDTPQPSILRNEL